MLLGTLVVSAWVVFPLARGDDGDGTGARRRPLWPSKPEKPGEKPPAKPRRPLWPGRKPAAEPEGRPLWPARREKPGDEPVAKPRRGLWPGGGRRSIPQISPIEVPPPVAEADLNLYEFLWFNGPEIGRTEAGSFGVGTVAAFLAAGIQSKTPPPPPLAPLPPEQAPPVPVMVAISALLGKLRDPQVFSHMELKQPRLAQRSPGAVSARLQPAGPPPADEPHEPPDSTVFPMGLVTEMTEPRSDFGIVAVEEQGGPAPEISALPIRLVFDPPQVVVRLDVPDPTRGTFDQGLAELASFPLATRRPASPRGPAEGWSRGFDRLEPVVVTEGTPTQSPVVARTEEPDRPEEPHRIMWPTPVRRPTVVEMPAAGLVVARLEQLRWTLAAPAIDGPAVPDSVVGDEMHQSRRQRFEAVAIPSPEPDMSAMARAAGPVERLRETLSPRAGRELVYRESASSSVQAWLAAAVRPAALAPSTPEVPSEPITGHLLPLERATGWLASGPSAQAQEAPGAGAGANGASLQRASRREPGVLPVAPPPPPRWRGLAVGTRRMAGRMRISARLQARAGGRLRRLALAGRTSPVGPPPSPPRPSPVPLNAAPGDWSPPASLPLLTVIRQVRRSQPGRLVKQLKRPRPFAGFADDGRLIAVRRQASDDLDDLLSPAPLPGLTDTRHWLGSGSGRGLRKTRRRAPNPWRLQ